MENTTTVPSGEQQPDKVITLPRNTRLNQTIINHLDDLFDLVPPHKLKHDIEYVFLLSLSADPTLLEYFDDLPELITCYLSFSILPVKKWNAKFKKKGKLYCYSR